MKTAQVVIGTNYGDEGKGLITDFLADQTEKALVIRHNSSAQAGHTVVAPAQDGTPERRHVFHHIGSGAFSGASTFLSRFFIAHPMLLGEELTALDTLGVTPTLYVDPRTPVAVPYDVILNQLAEEARGTDRHGSCGIGFSEAVERNLRPRFALTVRDFAKPEWVFDRLRAIRDGWLPRRLEPGELPPGQPIFEGAQGLLLDEDGADFPHVTRSKTGLTNVARIAQEVEINHLDVTYVTRAYLTRHGAGPLENELHDVPKGVTDPTNRPNSFQGSLRFAWLNIDLLAERIKSDLAFRAQGITATAQLAVTCLDQIPEVTYMANGEQRTEKAEKFINDLETITGLEVALTSRGPSRYDITLTRDAEPLTKVS